MMPARIPEELLEELLERLNSLPLVEQAKLKAYLDALAIVEKHGDGKDER